MSTSVAHRLTLPCGCQVFRKNMSVTEPPSITASKASDSWTEITFCPDLAKFGMSELEPDTAALMRKRVYDMAGVLGKGVKVRTVLPDVPRPLVAHAYSMH